MLTRLTPRSQMERGQPEERESSFDLLFRRLRTNESGRLPSNAAIPNRVLHSITKRFGHRSSLFDERLKIVSVIRL